MSDASRAAALDCRDSKIRFPYVLKKREEDVMVDEQDVLGLPVDYI